MNIVVILNLRLSIFQQQPRHMGPPGPGGPGGPGAPEGAMPPPTAPAEPHDNGPAAPATALVTTGPDGAALDEGSQQSTLSNASAGVYHFLLQTKLNKISFK